MCGTCGFSTHTKSAMLRHNLSHTGQKPHMCDECGSAYADKKRLRDHQASQHADSSGYGFSIPTFGCDFCGFSSRRKDNLRAHIRRVHPELSGEQNNAENIRTDESLATTSVTSRPVSSLQRTSDQVIVPEALSNTPKTEETKPDIRVMNNTLLASTKKLGRTLASTSSDKASTNCTTYNQEVSSSSTKLQANDRSHIVGHINQDGSIRPVASATPSHASGFYEDPLGLNCEFKGSALQQSSTDTRTDFKVTTSDSKGELFLNMDLVQSCNAAEIVSSAESSEN